MLFDLMMMMETLTCDDPERPGFYRGVEVVVFQSYRV